MTTHHLIITSGEPAGIGMDLCVLLAHKSFPCKITVLADPNALLDRAKLLNQQIHLTELSNPPQHQGNGILNVLAVSAKNSVQIGVLDSANSAYVLKMLDIAVQRCLNNDYSAMVTAPVHKEIINQAGITFIGHTEYLAEKTNTPLVVMMLIGGGLRVALATTHLPLRDVASTITAELLKQTIRILYKDLQSKFGILEPQILVAGLNPHAGEGGYLGDEEIRIIEPVIRNYSKPGVSGPYPADTLFTPDNIKRASAFLAMYHDQGLAVLKYASFGRAVNLTLGLPIIRTSVDHGTALSLAGTGNINPNSFYTAIEQAMELNGR